MGKGKIYRDRQVRYTDSRNGREITRLTGYLGHSWQLYFTHPCWVDGATALGTGRAAHLGPQPRHA